MAHSTHDTAREACLRELQRAFSRTDREQVAPSKTSDFAVFAQCCRSRNWRFCLYNGRGSTWNVCRVPIQPPIPVILLVAGCSTNFEQCIWGLGAVIDTCGGRILHRLRARVRAQYSSTSVMEAPAIAEGLRAVAPLLPRGFMVWPWCDNQTAAIHTNKRNIQGQPWQPQTMISADLELLYADCPFRTGWGPAEHDTKHRSILSVLNKEADAESRRAWTRVDTKDWLLPSTWCQGDLPTPVLEGPCGVIADIRRPLRSQFHWQQVNRRHADDVVLPFQFWESWPVPRELSDLWISYSGLHPHIAGNVMLMAQYNDWTRLVHDDTCNGKCAECGLPFVYPLCHALRDCPRAQMSLLAAIRVSEGLCDRHCKYSMHITRTWAGVQILTAKGEVPIIAGHPKYLSAQQAAMPSGMPLWPIMVGLRPNEATYSILQKSLDILAAAFCSRATSMVYPLIRDRSVAGLQGMEEVPPDADVRAQLRWDPRIHPTTACATQHTYHVLWCTLCVPLCPLTAVSLCACKLARERGWRLRRGMRRQTR